MHGIVESKAKVEKITPEVAVQYLERMRRNRRLSEGKVTLYAAAMSDGRWQLNGETIKFGRSGALIDGQHRLIACVRANTAFEAYVIREVDDDYFDTIDTGKQRTGGDILSMDGTANGNRVAAALKWLTCIKDRKEYINFAVSPDQLRLLLLEHPGIEDSLRITKTSGPVSASLVSALHYLFAKKDRAEADRFVDDLMMGAGLEKDDAVWVLRERLIKNRTAKEKLTRMELVALCIRAWNKRRSGKPTNYALKGQVLNKKGELTFPEIEG